MSSEIFLNFFRGTVKPQKVLSLEDNYHPKRGYFGKFCLNKQPSPNSHQFWNPGANLFPTTLKSPTSYRKPTTTTCGNLGTHTHQNQSPILTQIRHKYKKSPQHYTTGNHVLFYCTVVAQLLMLLLFRPRFSFFTWRLFCLPKQLRQR